jgi:hypothetical protein
MNIVGSIAMARQGGAVTWNSSGALSYGANHNVAIRSGAGDDWGNDIVLNAANGWSGETSQAPAHTHAITVGSAGSGDPVSIEQANVTGPIFMKISEG